MDAAEVARRLWEAFEARAWDEAAGLLHEDVVVEWPQSRERIRGRANVLALNRDYPGDWRIRVERAWGAGEGRAVTLVRIDLGGAPEWATSFFEVDGGRVRRATELWASPYPAPAWRARWVEPMDAP